MKSLIKTILLLLALLPASATAANYDFEVGGIYYNYLDVQGTVSCCRAARVSVVSSALLLPLLEHATNKMGSNVTKTNSKVLLFILLSGIITWLRGRLNGVCPPCGNGCRQ